MEFLDKNGLRTLWAQINNLVNSKIGSGDGIYLNTYTFKGNGTNGFCSFYTSTKNGVTLPLDTVGTYIGASGYYENSMQYYPIVAVENTRISTNIIFYYIDGTSLKRGFSDYSVTRVKMGS